MNNLQYFHKIEKQKEKKKKYLYVLSCEYFNAQNNYHRMTHTYLFVV
jgi:hypothetical protein